MKTIKPGFQKEARQQLRRWEFALTVVLRKPGADLPPILPKLSRSGTPEGTRTPDLLVRNQTLYPLSYGRVAAKLYLFRNETTTFAVLAGREGFEPSVRV